MRVPAALIASPLHWVYRLLCATLRFEEDKRQFVDDLDARKERMVFCLWHDELFPLMRVKRQLDIVTVVSPSYDGELLARVLNKLGLRTVRGSSSRGGVGALLGAAKMMDKDNIHACVTVDGPRGPRHKAKTGALFLAHHADAHVMPVRIIMEKAFRFGSWDRFQLPLPFSRVLVRFGEPWKVMDDCMTEQKASDEHREKLPDEALALAKLRLETALDALAEYPKIDSKKEGCP